MWSLSRLVDHHFGAAHVVMTTPRLFLESLDGFLFLPSHPFLPNRPPSRPLFFRVWIFKSARGEDQRPEDQGAIFVGGCDKPGFLNQPAQFNEFARARPTIHDPSSMIQAL
jgi:hypothetical protein